jgi:hypothetical protein
MYKKITYLVFLSILFTACQKEASFEQGNNPVVPVTTPDSNYLSKIYEIENDGITVDTIGISTYFYDAGKRVTLLTDSSISNSGVFFVRKKHQYFYNGTDTLPIKSIMEETDGFGSQTYTTTTFFYYNAAGQKTGDSAIMTLPPVVAPLERYVRVNSYQYTTGEIYGTGVSRSIYAGSPATTDYISKDTAKLDARGNVIKNTKIKTVPGLVLADTTISVMTYDGNPSPFARLSNYKAYIVFPFGETFSHEFVQKNNRLRMTETMSGTIGHSFDEDFTGFYSYRPDGYPKGIFIPDPLIPMGYYKIVYVYTAL